jgi:hypothetical protein
VVKKLIEKLVLSSDTKSYKDSSVKEVAIVNRMEFIPGAKRGEFMDEVFRILVPGGIASVITPYWSTTRAIQDCLYEWPPLCESSFLYFNKEWRERNVGKRPIKCDFDFTYGYGVEPDIANRNDETRSFALKNYTNAVQTLQVTLTSRKKAK